MIGKIIIQAFNLWVGWIFATYLHDMKHKADYYDLHQVRSRHDYRREMPLAARQTRFRTAGYTLFAGQCGLLAAMFAVRDARVQTRLTAGSLACSATMTLAVNLLAPQFMRSLGRLLRRRYYPLNANVTKIGDAPSLRSSAA